MSATSLGEDPYYYAADLDDLRYRTLRRAVERGEVLRLGTGLFVQAEYWSSFPETDREKMRSALIASRAGAPLVGRTAALFHRFPLPYSLDSLKGHPVELGHQRSNREKGIRYRHLGRDLPAHFMTVGEGRGAYFLSDPTRTCIDVARWYPLGEAVTYMDHAVRTGMTSRVRLREYLGEMKGFTGVQSARTAVRLATPWSESPRESLTKVAMFHAGLPAPLQQVGIRDGRGDLLGRVDFLFEGISVAVEYDGMGKHSGEFGTAPLAAVTSEFKRHGLLTQEGLLVFRLNAADFTYRDGIGLLAEQVRRASLHPRPFPADRFRAAGRAWGEE